MRPQWFLIENNQQYLKKPRNKSARNSIGYIKRVLPIAKHNSTHTRCLYVRARSDFKSNGKQAAICIIHFGYSNQQRAGGSDETASFLPSYKHYPTPLVKSLQLAIVVHILIK